MDSPPALPTQPPSEHSIISSVSEKHLSMCEAGGASGRGAASSWTSRLLYGPVPQLGPSKGVRGKCSKSGLTFSFLGGPCC